jgi:hypothetical protein
MYSVVENLNLIYPGTCDYATYLGEKKEQDGEIFTEE